MSTLFHYTRRAHIAPILTHGLYPSSRFHDLGLEMRRGAVYCWLAPEDDRMGYARDPEYACLSIAAEPSRCVVADMDLATKAYQYLRGIGGRPRDPEQAKHYASLYQSTAVPMARYMPGLFAEPEVLVKGPIEANCLTLVESIPLPYAKGEQVRITALRANGTPYRWWDARVETVTPDCVVTFSPAGGVVSQPTGQWVSRVSGRAFFWGDRHYNLHEFYADREQDSGLYVHIASPPQFLPGEIRYRDHELDILQYVGKPAQVVDQDEFDQAVARYGYSPEFQATCREAVDEALRLVEGWIWPLRRNTDAR